MHAYQLRIPEQQTALPQTINFEASNDAAAAAMVRTYYSEIDSELWHEGRLVQRYARPEPRGEPS